MRILTGLVLGAVVIFGAIIGPAMVALIMALALVFAIWELAVTMRNVNIRVPFVMTLLSSWLILFAAWYGGLTLVMITYIITCGAVMFYSGLENTVAEKHSSFMSGVFIITYLPLCLSFIVLTSAQSSGALKTILIILAVVCSDTGGLFAGMKFGRNQLAPVISPKKTWEGFAGGFLFCLLVTYIYAYFGFNYIFYNGNWYFPLVLSAVACSLGTFGDLTESVIKRDANVKDIGGILPGHGGVMDRLDSMVLYAPVAYMLVSLML